MESSEFKRKMLELERYRELQNEIVGYNYELTKWSTIGMSVSPNHSTGSGGRRGSSKPETAAVNMELIRANIQRDIERCKKEREHIKKAVEKVDKRYYRIVLQYKFLSGMSNRTIAEKLKKNERSVYRLIKNAVEYIDM